MENTRMLAYENHADIMMKSYSQVKDVRIYRQNRLIMPLKKALVYCYNFLYTEDKVNRFRNNPVRGGQHENSHMRRQSGACRYPEGHDL